MPKWTGNKANPSDINGGEQYKGGDRLSREAVNAIVNNSIYASEKSDEALEKADSAFMANGTVSRVGGVAQPFLDFDSDPQAQINQLTNLLSKAERLEVIYDMNSDDINENKEKTSGLAHLIELNLDYSKYSRVYAFGCSESPQGFDLIIDLKSPTTRDGEYKSAVCSWVGLDEGEFRLYSCSVTIDSSKQKLTPSFSNVRQQHSITNTGYIFKIIGAY